MKLKETDSADIVFFQSYSVIKTLALVKYIRHTPKILLAWKNKDCDNSERGKKIVKWMIHWINPQAEIQQLEFGDVVPNIYLQNKQGVKYSDSLSDKFSQSKAYKLLHDVIEDDHIGLFYKASLSRVVPTYLLYFEVANRELRDGKKMILVPDFLGEVVSERKRTSDSWELGYIPPELYFWDRAADLVSCFKWIVSVVALPGFMFLKHMKNGFARIPEGYYKVAMPILWGINKGTENTVIDGVKRFDNDLYLYRKHFSPGDIVHVFHEGWVRSRTDVEIDSWREGMKSRGIPYADRDKFGVNKKLLGLAVLAFVRILKGLFRPGKPAPFASIFWKATVKGLYHYLLKQYEMENINYQVEYVKDDYNAGHVTATIAANQQGRKRIGASHAATIYDAPQLAFVHFDSYVVLCSIYTNTFHPHWESLRLEKIGRESIDSIVCEKKQCEHTLKKIVKLYGKRKWVVTFLFPGNVGICFPEQWDKIYQALSRFSEIELDCHVFFRFRNMEALQRYPIIKKISDLSDKDPRIHVNQEEFNTGASSFGINEAAVIGIPVFTFSYTRAEPLYFSEYGSDFVLQEASDVLRVLNGLKTNFQGFDCNWERLRKDADYHQDGKNSDRLCDVVYEAMPDQVPRVTNHE
jgi:hypothetical protein